MIASVAVTPDGTVMAASVWDEAGRCIGLYRQGQPNEHLLQQYNGRGGHEAWGWGTAGEAVAAEGEHIFLVNTSGQLLRFRWSVGDINSARYVDQVPAQKTQAMDARGDLLVLAGKDGVVEIRSAADLALRSSFKVEAARGVAIDPSCKSLWLIEDRRIVQRSLNGIIMSDKFPDVEKPSALAFAPDGRLVVCDDGPAQQVLIYEMGKGPRLLRRFGQRGGLRAGTPGMVAPDKLYGLQGAGLDSEGNLYVALCINVQGAATAIRSFDPQDNLRWQVESHAFCDVYGFDPQSDGTVLYGMDEIIEFDPQAEPGKGWRTRAITLDAIANPDDPRTQGRSGSAFLRYLNGRRLLYTIPQQANRIDLFTFEEAPSQIARYAGRPVDAGWALHVDAKGDIWRGDAPQRQIHRYRFQRWNNEGQPLFDVEKPDKFAWPLDFTEIGRVVYVPQTDALYVSGYTKDKPAPSWGLMGAVLRRYDGWTSKNPECRWTIDLPTDDENLYPKSFDVAADYVFTVQVKPTRRIPAMVNVFRAADGSHVGFMKPGPEVGGNSGWVDMTHGTQAMRRKDGDYLVIVEENYRAKNLIYRWQPPSDHDRIRPYSANPYYWQYKGKPVLLLGGSWQDNLYNHPTGLAEHVDLLVANGGNYVRNTMSHRNLGNVFAYAQRDGKFDLDEFNEEYWQRFENFLRLTCDRNIIVQIEVWDPWDYFADHQSQGGWSKNPFNPASNVTYTAEESGLPDAIDYNPARTPSQHAFWRTVPALQNNELVLRYQRAYVDKMLSIALQYPHVLYCVHNESGEELAFSAYWADHIHRRAREAGRMVFVTDMRYDINIVQPDHHVIYDDPQRYTFLDISQNNQQSGQTHYDRILYVREYVAANPRPLNNTKIYNLRGGDEESVARMFRIVFAGGASARFHRPHPREDADAREKSSHYGLGLSPRGQAALRSARILTDTIHVFACKPRNDLLSERSSNEAYCLAEPGRQYAVYFPDGGSVKLDVSEAIRPLQVRWLDIDRSAWQQPQTVDGGGTLELKTPGAGHWAVVLLASAERVRTQSEYLLGGYDREGRIENLARFGKTHVDVVIPYGAKYYPGWTDPLEPVFHRYVRLSWGRWKDALDHAREQGKPFIPVGLAFILPDNPGSPRPLTWEEMRYHFYTGGVADSDGFIFYAHHHAHHLDGHYWKMVERLFAQMNPIGIAIRNGRMNDPRIGVSEGPDTLVYRYGVDSATGNSALVAVNIARWDAADKDGQTLTNVRFTLPQGVRPASVTLRGEDRSPVVT